MENKFITIHKLQKELYFFCGLSKLDHDIVYEYMGGS